MIKYLKKLSCKEKIVLPQNECSKEVKNQLIKSYEDKIRDCQYLIQYHSKNLEENRLQLSAYQNILNDLKKNK